MSRKAADDASVHSLTLTKKRKQALIGRGEFSRLNSVKKCPICGRGLEEGYLNAVRGVYWSTEKHKLWNIVMDEVMLGALWNQENVPALRCDECGIAVIDYRASKQTPKSFLKKCVKCGEEIPLACEECQHCGMKQ